jgi:hypothetical protein
MTISGKLTKWQLVSRSLSTALACLLFSGGGCWFFLHAVRIMSAGFSPPDQFTQIAAVSLFPVMGAIAFGLILWSDGWRIVEFTCDEHSFRFRKLRSACDETRELSEITKVQEAYTAYRRGRELTGYAVGFRDGTEAFVGLRLPNAKALADRLNSHRQPAPPAPSGLGRFLRLVFGRIEFAPVSSAKTEERVRKRYCSEIAELAELGFEYRCCYGEAFPLARLVFILPAVLMLLMCLDRRPLRIHGGTKIMACYPLLISRDKTTYANPCLTGVKLYTAFTDGTFLVSATAKLEEVAGPPMTKWCGAASMTELCAGHRLRVQTFESAGKRVDRQACFPAYAGLLEREAALQYPRRDRNSA